MEFETYLKNLSNKELCSKKLIKFMFYETEKVSDITEKWLYILKYKRELSIRNMLHDSLSDAINEEAGKIIGVDFNTILAASYLYTMSYTK